MRRFGHSKLTCSTTEIALFLLLGEALRQLPPDKRKLRIYYDDVDRMRRGVKVPFRVGFKMDEKTFKRMWVSIWGPSNLPDLKYREEGEKSRVFQF